MSLIHLSSNIMKYMVSPAIFHISFHDNNHPLSIFDLSFIPFRKKMLKLLLYFRLLKMSFNKSISIFCFLPSSAKNIQPIPCSLVHLLFTLHSLIIWLLPYTIYWKHSFQNYMYNSVAKSNGPCTGHADKFACGIHFSFWLKVASPHAFWMPLLCHGPRALSSRPACSLYHQTPPRKPPAQAPLMDQEKTRDLKTASP